MPDLRILFVDDEPQILRGLRRMLVHRRREWMMEFVESGAEALVELKDKPYDVLVTDMRMPGMSGADLLAAAAQEHPGVARIVLSGAASELDMMLSVESAHQYLSKPCEPERLESVIERALMLKQRLDAPEVIRLASVLSRLPSFPAITGAIVREMQSVDPSLRRIGDIVAKDVALSAKLLQLVNSSFFGLAREVVDPRKAVMLLGSARVTALSLGSGLYVDVPATAHRYSFDRLWVRSNAIAIGAERISKALGGSHEVQALSYMSGLLSVTGTLVIASQATDRFLRIADPATQIADEGALLDEFGATSAQLGAYVLGLWGLPATVVEAVAFHRTPSAVARAGGALTALAAVHIAASLIESGSLGVDPAFDEAFIGSTGLECSLEDLVEACCGDIAA